MGRRTPGFGAQELHLGERLMSDVLPPDPPPASMRNAPQVQRQVLEIIVSPEGLEPARPASERTGIPSLPPVRRGGQSGEFGGDVAAHRDERDTGGGNVGGGWGRKP
jgi:hypothetical protein